MKSTVTKKLITTVILMMVGFVSCVRAPQQVLTTSNQNYTLDLLFEHEGCKVYRFKDGERYVYWTDCRGKVETAYQDSNKYGSKTVTVQNETTTADSSLTRKK